MPRQEFHTDNVKIDQKPPVNLNLDPDERESEIVEADASVLLDKDRLGALAFNEEPVTIRIEPSSEKNAANAYPVWCNGVGAEVLIRGKWVQMAYLPVGQELITKRKYVAIMLGSKIDRVDTVHDDATVAQPRNEVRRVTTAACSFSVLEDKNPRGHAWFTELRRRNF